MDGPMGVVWSVVWCQWWTELVPRDGGGGGRIGEFQCFHALHLLAALSTAPQPSARRKKRQRPSVPTANASAGVWVCQGVQHPQTYGVQ